MVLTLPVGLLSALTVALLRSRTTSVAVVPSDVVVGELQPGMPVSSLRQRPPLRPPRAA